MLAAAVGLWQRRYWAVLGFEALLGIAHHCAPALSLLVAANVAAVLLCLGDHRRSAAPLFWKLIRVMARHPAAAATAAGAGRLACSATMPERAYDCIVIGSGPGGYVAAIRAAQLGMKTAVVEKDMIGGRCLNYACIPAKAVLRVADILSEIDEASDFGITVPERTSTSPPSASAARKVVKTLTGGVAGLMKKNKIDVLEGEGGADRPAPTSGVGDDGDRGARPSSSPRARCPSRSRARSSAAASSARRRRGRSRSCRRRSRWSARARRAPRSPRPTAAWARDVLLFEALDRVLPTEDADISKVAGRALAKQNIDDPHRDAGGGRRSPATTSVSLLLRRRAGRGRLARDRRRPRARRRGRSASTTPASSSTTTASIAVDGRQRTSTERRLRDRRPRARPGARPQVLRRGHHRRRGRRRAARRIRSSTRTSRAPRSARRTSPRSG